MTLLQKGALLKNKVSEWGNAPEKQSLFWETPQNPSVLTAKVGLCPCIFCR